MNSNWDQLVERFGGIQGLIDMIDQEGLAYFVCDYEGPESFEGGPLEEAAKQINDGVNRFSLFLGVDV